MKTSVKQQIHSNSEKSTGKNQVSSATILQTYKNTSVNLPLAQLRSYSQYFKVKEDIVDSDVHDWNIMRRKLGIADKGSKAGAAGANAKASLDALGIAGTDFPMTAHMIPRRVGGMGSGANARPWANKFETTTWKDTIDDVFDGEFIGKKKDATVAYTIDTTDMDDAYYDTVKAKSTKPDAVKNNAGHKANIQEIPTAVSATVGSKSLAKTTGPITNLIK